MYLDSHVHFWKLERGDYSWIQPNDELLYQNYLPERLAPLLQEHKVEGIIVVEAASTKAEIEYMLKLAQEYPFIRGVVGGLNPASEEFQEDFKQLRRNPLFAGIRVYGSSLHDGPLSATVAASLKLLEEENCAVDFLLWPDDLPFLLKHLHLVPHLKAVINHLGNPSVEQQEMEPWSTRMAQAAQFPHTAVKISGMITKASGYHPERLQEFIGLLAASFGPDRLLFGSDWPVALRSGGYAEVIRLFEEVLPGTWSESERDKVRRVNAAQIYGIQGGGRG